jgi:hypothetical protein
MAARISIAFSLAFLLLLTLLHFLKPDYAPSWRMISEYEIGQWGWMMRLAFLCWSGAVAALDVAIWHDLRGAMGKIARVWLVIIAVALIGAALFAPDPIFAQTRNITNILHSTAGVIVIMTFPIVILLARAALGRNPAWRGSMQAINWATLLVWFSLLLFFGVEIYLSVTRPGVGAGPDLPIGWPNRFFALCYHIWLIVVAWAAMQHAGQRQA